MAHLSLSNPGFCGPSELQKEILGLSFCWEIRHDKAPLGETEHFALQNAMIWHVVIALTETSCFDRTLAVSLLALT